MSPSTADAGVDDYAFLKTNHSFTDTEGATKVITLAPYGKSASKEHPTPTVEPFWYVKRVESLDQANMELVSVTMHGVTAVTLPHCAPRAHDECTFELPIMIPTKEIPEGHELVCYFKQDGEKKAKRLRIE
jgi:hypothetical protein